MPSLLSRDGFSKTPWLLPTVLLFSSTLAFAGTPPRTSLLTSAIAWLSICTYTTLRTGSRSLLEATPAKYSAWSAGSLLALAQVNEKASDVTGLWWAKALVPFILYVAITFGMTDNDHNDTAPESPSAHISKPTHIHVSQYSKNTLFILVLAGLAATYVSAGSNTSIALGLSCALMAALSLLLVGKAKVDAKHHRPNGSVIYSANGLLTQPSRSNDDGAGTSLSLLRDVAAASALCTAIAALSMDSLKTAHMTYPGVSVRIPHERWTMWQSLWGTIFGAFMVVVHMLMNSSLVLMVAYHGAFLTSLPPLLGAATAQVLVSFSPSRLWFTTLCTGSAFQLFFEHSGVQESRVFLRASKIFTLVCLLSFAGLGVSYVRQSIVHPVLGSYHPHDETQAFESLPPPHPLAPLQFKNNQLHPVDQLVRDAAKDWTKTLQSQSKTLAAAVAEYKRRYGMHPPPHFDKWFEFARTKNVQLIDEYDTIYHSLLPFWGLSPASIRSRTREALGFGPNNLIGLLIRDGSAKHVEGGAEWQQEATIGMMAQFVQYLPDMDLAFNIHDEPRVVVPHDQLAQFVQLALDQNLPRALKQTPKNAFSARPKDTDSGRRIAEVKRTRFNVFAHQPTWLPSRLSCPPDSPAKDVDESLASDNLTAYALGELGFVYNHTAFSNICNSPSFASSHGFFDRPNAFNVVHDLFPIFSQSKMSCFQDILYPSPWYWYGKVSYEEEKDMEWQAKANRLWWRGSTTGGFSRDGGWRRQHRQQFVRKLNALDTAQIMANTHANEKGSTPQWATKEVLRQELKDVIDVHFSHVGQCDPGDCDAQREFFTVTDPVDQQDAWKYKYLLDIDGNAFSGRFYAFLKSHSLTFKMAVFREWHEEWIKPWVHYIPLSLRANEALEAVRYFAAEDEGKEQGVQMAEAGRAWANEALRNEDFEVWFFRLLLEYGRLIDDNRESIGFSGS